MNWKQFQILVGLALVASLMAPAQTTSSAPKKSSPSSSGGDLYEINLFGGGNFTKRQKGAPNQDIVDGGVSGFRIVENLWNYVSLEQTGMVHGTANVRYQTPGSFDQYALGSRLRQFHFNPILNLKPREARIRPFLTMGFGFDYFGITDGARRQLGNQLNGVNSPFKQVTNLEAQYRPAFNYGGGVKAKVTDRIGLRFDLRGFSTASPDFGVNTSGPSNAIVYTRTTPQNSMQATGGVTFYLGAISTGPVCEFRVGSIEPSTNTVWLSEGASYKVPVTNNCLGVTPKYKWTLDGAPVTGDELAAVKGLKAGEQSVKVVVEADTTKVTDGKTRNFLKKFPIPATERTATLVVKQPKVELVSVVVDPSNINYNGTSTVTSTISYDGPAAGPTVKLNYSGEGGSFNPGSSTLTLKPGNNVATTIFTPNSNLTTPGGPSKTLTLQASATDESGKSIGAKSAGLTVGSAPAPPAPRPAPPKLQPMQLDDVIFAKGSARTNNCGKRILDQAFERAAASGEYDVLLVGHYDAVESKLKVRDPKTKKSTTLDVERVRQVAAVLSAGTEPCKRLERSRIKVAYVGAEQLSPFKTSLCEATVKEKANSKISAKDGNAKNRRVEVWLVPKSGPMPNGIAGITDAPAAEIQSAGCPK